MIGEVDEIITPEVVRVILSKNGLDSEVVYGNIRDLKRFISDGRPVIVLMRFGDFCWKYCIVFGYDEENIYLGNCNGLPKTLSLRDFENCWGFSHDYFGRKCLDCKGPSDKFTMIVPVWN